MKKKNDNVGELNYLQRGRIIIIFNKYFRAFLEKERAIAGNKIYTFSSRTKRTFLNSCRF